MAASSQETKRAANLHLVLIAVLALFGTFMGALAYAQWATRGMKVYRSGE